jgi:DNA-binding response OmpR family regulator
MTTDTAPKILVVDDDPAICTLVHRFLNQKYHVDSAADGETALALFEKLKPLLIVLDGNLPDTTGYHLGQETQRRTNVFAIVRSQPHRRS